MRLNASWSSARQLLLVLASVGCQALTDLDAQCAQSADCERLFGAGHVCVGDGVCSAVGTGRGAAQSSLPPRWACLDRPFVLPQAEAGRSVEVSIDIYDDDNGD